MRRVLRVVAAAALGCALPPAFAQVVMEPGGWEMHTVMTAKDPEDGSPVKLGETTIKSCLSREYLSRDLYLTPANDERKMRERGAKCAVSDVKRSEASASWRMICEMPDGSRMDMSIRNTVSKHELQSELRQLLTREGRDFPIQVLAKARHIGPCTADMPKQ